MVYWWEVVSLATTTSVMVITLVVNGITRDEPAVSKQFRTEISPAGYTYAIWGIVYGWQVLWLAYAWSFIFRPKDVPTISTGVHWAFAFANCCNIFWMEVWVRKMIGVAMMVFVLLNFFLYAAVHMLLTHFYSVRKAISKGDYWLTWALPVNGLVCYATWTTLASFVNLAAVLQYTCGLGAASSGTMSLVLLTAVVVTYMVMGSTVFLYVFSVHPTIAWTLIGILVAHWSLHSRNTIYVLVLLLVVAVHVAVMIGKFVHRRPVVKLE